MKTKALATLAVMMMVFAGAGFFVGVADADDPPATYDFTVTYNGLVSDEDTLKALDDMGATISYKAKLADDLEDRITILNLKYYEALDDAGMIVGEYVVFDNADLAVSDYKNGIKAFTYAEFNKLGKLVGGVESVILFADVLSGDDFDADYGVEIVTEADVDEAVAEAVAIAVAEVIEYYDGYLSPAEVKEAIAEAIADLSDYIYTQADMDKVIAQKDAEIEEAKKIVPPGYISQADADKMVEEAVAKVTTSDDKDKTIYLAIAIVLGVVVVALAGYTVYGVVKASKAKKAEKVDKPQENA